jgi:tetratricopeptide (TPR) repeat protein
MGYLNGYAHLEAMRERFDIAREVISRAIALGNEQGLYALLYAQAYPGAGYVELLAGDPVAAERHLRLACEETARLGELGFLASITPLLVDAVLEQGRDEEALELTERWRPERLTVPEDADAQAGWRRVRARALARRGALGDAERIGREAVAIGAGTDYLNLKAKAVADLGEVLLLAGRAEESAAMTAEAIRLYELKGNVAAARTLQGSITSPARGSG